ncbi:hypothetical protein [Mangrovihabitans endophyticus]|uniref:Glycosyl transferase family 28 C-terminal domain-containing protein n=1 Tax=Mangrovihabitans endophyticus TaxID=1751298 RepID=A0A8J3BV88_9ACTN|nr:hypothetical protein [Mangrovihabitans endophyticus]GGK72468.1 hypothetical protein GCM10012284_02830 [Mangrovihabitans endophyticus]
MRSAVILVKNGIGFGHIRRALLIAEALQHAGRIRPVIISQASSLALYQATSVRVVNFPLLHRVPSAITEDFYTDLMNRVLERLSPAVVIEDTYPDARYRHLAALIDRPRILVMRRLDETSFDRIRERGDFAHYDRILIAQDERDFRQEEHSPESLAAIEYGSQFAFVGNIFATASSADIADVRRAYTSTRPLIVVNGGAGGDQMPDGYGDRLFNACSQVAAALAEEGNPARFVFVTGPYYAGRPLHPTENVEVRRFEPRLSALLAAADVAVIKPGNNALSETLAGQARLILVPDVSFMEGLDEHAERVASRYDGSVGEPSRASLEPLIREALIRPPRVERVGPSRAAIDAVVREVHRMADQSSRPSIQPKSLLLMLFPPGHGDAESIRKCLPRELEDAVVVGDGGPAVRFGQILPSMSTGPRAVVVGADTRGIQPQELVEAGVQLLIHGRESAPVARWLRLHPPSPALLSISAEFVVARVESAERVHRRLARLLERSASAVLVLDLGGMPTEELPTYLQLVGSWLSAQPVQLVNLQAIVSASAARLLERKD